MRCGEVSEAAGTAFNIHQSPGDGSKKMTRVSREKTKGAGNIGCMADDNG